MESGSTGSSSDDLPSWNVSTTLSGVNLISSTINPSSRSNRTDVSPQSHNRMYALSSIASIIRAPLSTILEYSGILRPSRYSHSPPRDTELAISQRRNHADDNEVSIRIISSNENTDDSSEVQEQSREARTVPESSSYAVETGTADSSSSNGRDDQRYDIQQAARWLEQILPFSLLLFIVFIREHLQEFSVSIWIAIILFKSNDILRKQAALKEERKVSVLAGASIAFTLHVAGIYWLFSDDLLNPLIMLPPTQIPGFWHAIIMIFVNDTLVRQAAMVVKCLLLLYYRKSRGHMYRKQGQMLTLVEYSTLFYRALLPTPVWYRFFLDKQYGSLFPSLMTGLYLTFKLTYVVEKMQCFFSAAKALSRKEVHYGSYASTEQVYAAGNHCAICQEKLHLPILLRCKHIFCEDCVSEWFERERTCPLCRALVKPADMRSFSDGSTSLVFQIF